MISILYICSPLVLSQLIIAAKLQITQPWRTLHSDIFEYSTQNLIDTDYSQQIAASEVRQFGKIPENQLIHGIFGIRLRYISDMNHFFRT